MKTRFAPGLLMLLAATGLTGQDTGYRPPFFPGEDRIESVKQMESKVHLLFWEQIESHRIPGIAYGVLVDDSLVIASACGLANVEKDIPASTSTRFRIASMSKSFTAMAILKLRDEGWLSLDDPASDYLPEVKQLQPLTSDSPPILVRNLLNMSAGFPEDNPWGDRQLAESDEMLAELVKSGISFSTPTSTAYEYSNTGYAMLGLIITRVTGMPYQEYIRREIFLPLGMVNTVFEYEDVPPEKLAMGYSRKADEWVAEPLLHDGAFGAMGGIITTIEDFSLYAGFHLQAWPPRNGPDRGPLKRSSLREMHTPSFTRLDAGNTDRHGESCALMSGYGYGLRTDLYCDGLLTISHGGALPGFGSKFYLFPEYGLAIMAFGNRTYTGPLPFEDLTLLLLDSAGLQPRILPPSDLLVSKQYQVNELIRSWVSETKTGIPTLSAEREAALVAENLYPDRSREIRMKDFARLFSRAGEILGMEEIIPENQLRGTYDMKTEKGILTIGFTLTPEATPRVQYLEGEFTAKDP